MSSSLLSDIKYAKTHYQKSGFMNSGISKAFGTDQYVLQPSFLDLLLSGRAVAWPVEGPEFDPSLINKNKSNNSNKNLDSCSKIQSSIKNFYRE